MLFELSIQKNPEKCITFKKTAELHASNVFNTDKTFYLLLKIQLCITEINYNLKYINIYQYYCFTVNLLIK